MKFWTSGILILFAAFIVLLFINPRLSCFGRKIKSPFYPLSRKKKQLKKTSLSEDYGFSLDDEKSPNEEKKEAE